jgi:hypothetical protein
MNDRVIGEVYTSPVGVLDEQAVRSCATLYGGHVVACVSCLQQFDVFIGSRDKIWAGLIGYLILDRSHVIRWLQIGLVALHPVAVVVVVVVIVVVVAAVVVIAVVAHHCCEVEFRSSVSHKTAWSYCDSKKSDRQ